MLLVHSWLTSTNVRNWRKKLWRAHLRAIASTFILEFGLNPFPPPFRLTLLTQRLYGICRFHSEDAESMNPKNCPDHFCPQNAGAIPRLRCSQPTCSCRLQSGLHAFDDLHVAPRIVHVRSLQGIPETRLSLYNHFALVCFAVAPGKYDKVLANKKDIQNLGHS